MAKSKYWDLYSNSYTKASTPSEKMEKYSTELVIDATVPQGRGGWVQIGTFGTLSYEVSLAYEKELQYVAGPNHKNWLRDYDPTYTNPWYGGADGDFDQKLGPKIRFYLDSTGATPGAPGQGLIGLAAADGDSRSYITGAYGTDWSMQTEFDEGILKVNPWDSDGIGKLYYYIQSDYGAQGYDGWVNAHRPMNKYQGIIDIRKSGLQTAHLDVPIAATYVDGGYHYLIDLYVVKLVEYNNGGAWSYDGIALVRLKVKTIKAPQYTVSFDTRGGSEPPKSLYLSHGMYVDIPKDIPTLSGGVEFRGWYDPKTKIIFQAKNHYFGNYNNVLEAAFDTTISFVANGGSGAPGPIVKRYREAVRLPIDEPQKPGYIFTAWNTNINGTGTSYPAGGTIPANILDSFTLYAVWQKDIDPPTVKSLTTIRCERDGTPADEGTCCLVTCVWEVDTVNNARNTGTVTGKYAPRRGEERTFQFRSGASGTSGTATALVEGLDVDTQFTFTATVTDIKRSTSMSSILTRARFVLDFKTGGLGMGIGSAAPLNGLAVGWETQFDDDVIIYGNLDAKEVKYSYNAYDANSSPTSYEMVNPQGTFTVGDVYVQRVGQLVQLSVRITTSVALTAGTNETVGTIASPIRPRRDIGISSDKAVGRITSGGNISVTPLFDISSGSSITVGATYFTGV